MVRARRLRRCLSYLLFVATGASLLVSSAPAAPNRPVLMIGDSISAEVLWHPAVAKALEDNLAVDWQVAVCRTVTGLGCPYQGQRPSSLVDLVSTLGHVPPVVVVELGYNDSAQTFAASIDAAMSSLVAAGAQHVIWLTLRAARDPYPALNAMLRQAVSRWPQLQLIDWDTITHNSYNWFQSDGIHLLKPAGIAMAHLINAAVLAILDPLHITRPPRLQPGHSYAFQLDAVGGAPPDWFKISGRPPHGFRLLTDGRVSAKLRTTARADFEITVRDADGVTASLPVHVNG